MWWNVPSSPYPSKFLLLLLLHLCHGSRTCFGITAANNETDGSALLRIRNQLTDDPFGIFKLWNETTHFCRWHGVACGRKHRRVTVLNLRSLSLGGSISPFIGNLTFLKELDFSGNKLGDGIPEDIFRLRRLQKLSLRNNSLRGTIPRGLSDCSDLSYIDLAFNFLIGIIPEELGFLNKLQILSLSRNNLTGTIPHSLGNLSSLNVLSLAKNGLQGTIPDSLGQLEGIQILALGENELSGPIPLPIFNLSSLEILDLPINWLEGSLPLSMFATLPNLQDFGIGFNNISGIIPSSISNASNLVSFRASRNQLQGMVPSLAKLNGLQILTISTNQLGNGGDDDLNFLAGLANATELYRVNLQNNYFRGAFPRTFGDFSTNLVDFSIGSNQAYGIIPDDIGNLANLEVLDMWGNNFSGSIPESIGKLRNLNILYFDSNKLSGSIPSSLGNLVLMTDLRLGNNDLYGSLPPSLGSLHNLGLLDISRNNLGGSIPREIFSLSSLSILLNLSRNGFTGDLPGEVGNLKNLGVVDLSENGLSGNVPAALGSCISLEFLSLAGNNFEGTIPNSFGLLRGLQFLDLSRNNLSGEIPYFFGELRLLLTLNLSYNNFEGVLSLDGIFQNASEASVAGNSRLCGGIPEFHLPNCTIRKPTTRSLSLMWKLVISIVSVTFGVTLLITVLLLWRVKRKTKGPSASTLGELFPTVSYQSLLKATDGFSGENLVGVGAFGSVYKGILELDGQIRLVAVKVLDMSRHGAVKSFLSECEALRNMRHRNLVKVLTVSSSIDNAGNDFKCLVYEFMVNGSLNDWLHPDIEGDNQKRTLSILQRLNIAIDVATAVEYLHHGHESPIVHCDLKPSNILLDEKMVSHVGDFGLAKFIPESGNQTHPIQMSSAGVRGSSGYIAPEYGMGHKMSTSGDVYSYGIMLLEMFSGMKPTSEMFNDDLSLHCLATKVVRGQLEVEEIADPVLLPVRGNQETRSSVDGGHRISADASRCSIVECLSSVLRLGVACSAESPKDRMDISDVTIELHAIRSKFQAARSIQRHNVDEMGVRLNVGYVNAGILEVEEPNRETPFDNSTTQ